MKIVCHKCNKNLVIPDDKLPDKDSFKVTCPQCGEKINVNLKGDSGNETESTGQVDDFDETLDLALICESNGGIASKLSSAIKQLNYKPVTAQNIDDAFEKMRFTQFKLVILSETFDSATPDNNEILAHFQKMQMVNRRHIFIALLGKELETLNNGTAFSRSVNVVVNEGDINNIKAILKKSIADNDQFYKVYKGIMRELGKI